MPIRNRILTVPNQLTFLRLAFLPFFIIAIKYDRYDWALGILVLAGLSDGLDGFLARGLNQRTPLGAYLDPIADKLLLSSSYFVLALKGKIGWWLAILVLGPRRADSRRVRRHLAHGRIPPVSAEYLGKGDDILRDFARDARVAAGRVGKPAAAALARNLRLLRGCSSW